MMGHEGQYRLHILMMQSDNVIVPRDSVFVRDYDTLCMIVGAFSLLSSCFAVT